MGRVEFLPSSRIIVEGKSVRSLGATSLPVSKDGQELSFEDVLKKAYKDFPKFKMHADLHLSEYKNAIDQINGLPTQPQDKWKLLKLCLWYQYGSPIFGEIFNLTPDATRKEATLLSNLPAELTNKISKLLEDDKEGEEVAENTTTVPLLNKYKGRVNPEKREFVILAEGGQRWKTLTDRQRLVLEERYLADQPATVMGIAGRSGISPTAIFQYETAGLRKLGFFGEPIFFTRQQLQNIFQNAKEEDLNSLTPKERELLEGFYGANARVEHSYPTIKSVAADIKINAQVAVNRHKTAIEKLLHTKRTIRTDMTLSPTSEQVEFMRQKIPLEGTYEVAKEMGKSPHTVRRWQRQEGIQLQRRVRQSWLPPPEVLEFIKTNYPNKSSDTLGTETSYSKGTIIKWLRGAGYTIRKRGQKINS